jgi:hypothetical protein
MMTMTAGTVKGELEQPLLGIGGPIKLSPVNIQVLYHIPRTGNTLDHEKLKEITVRKMTIHTLSRKALPILAAVHRLLP